MPEEVLAEENESLLAKTLDYTTRNFLEICKTHPGKIGEGALFGAVGSIAAGMSYEASAQMMWAHAALGAVWGLGTLKAFSEGYQASSNNDKNIKKAETEIRVFKELMEIKGESGSVEPIILAINETLKSKGAPELSEEVITRLTNEPSAENFNNLIRKTSDINSSNLLVAASMLGIVATVVGFAVMEGYKNGLPEVISTAAAATTASISSGFLNTAASSSASISENTYLALKNMNNTIFADLKISFAEQGKTNELPDIEKLRAPRGAPQIQSGAQVVSNDSDKHKEPQSRF